MLNISVKSVASYITKSDFKSFRDLEKRDSSHWLLRILSILFIIGVLGMFLPWTQNIRSNGKVTTLNPYDKPQEIQALVGGKINQWFVKEGDIVNIGDTIAILSEAKEEYLDPKILENTQDQQEAKASSANAYQRKMGFLKEQLTSLREYRDAKLNQLSIKQKQIDLELATAELDLEAANTYLTNAENQLQRMEVMYDKGIKSLTDLEGKRLSFREGRSKKLSVENKINKLLNDKTDVLREIDLTKAEFEQKASKVESDIRDADSYRLSLLGESTKLQSKYNQIEQRQKGFVITSPIKGRITKILRNGIGEFVKAQESLATIVPLDYQKAVSLYIQPNDMPLVRVGQDVRIQFDGWPAIIFSGWPNNSFGVFDGQVYAIDNDISQNGLYRIIVVEDKTEKDWPDLVRIGSGAKGLLLLNDVRVYYELWRKLNGFPPDFYEIEKDKEVKNKAPLRKVK